MMKVIRVLRHALALPVHLVAGIVVLFTAFMFQWLPQLLYRAGLGSMLHVYMPIVRVRRMIDGSPIWSANDLRIGIQPRNAKEQALADADPTLRKVPCLCGFPTCKYKDGVYITSADLVCTISPPPEIDISSIVDAQVEKRLQERERQAKSDDDRPGGAAA